MSLKTPLNQNLDIKCPKCNHKFVYNLKLDDIKKVHSNKSVENEKVQYEFLSYVVCKLNKQKLKNLSTLDYKDKSYRLNKYV